MTNNLSRCLRLGAVVLCLAVAGGGAALADGDISGTWRLTGYRPTSLPAAERVPRTLEGTPPPMRPEAEELYKKRMADSDRGEPFVTTSAVCLPLGVPLMMMAASYPIQIMQTPTHVAMLFEEQHTYRLIDLVGGHPEEIEPGYFGHSTGRWEGDVLVVDTVGLVDRTTLDLIGMPHSDELHVVERIRRVDAQTLENLITITDPKVFTRPWTTRMRYTAFPDPLMEYVCENKRSHTTPGSGQAIGGS